MLGRPAGSADLRRRVGYLTQAPSVYADLTVRENARYFAALQGRGRAEADRAVADVGLADAADQLVGTLSGGQRSRASLACALVGEPELLVLDEPTVGQDPVLRADLWARFHAMAAAGTTLLVSSHVMDEAGPLRPAAADPRGPADRRRHPGRGPRRHRAPTTWRRRSCA